MDDDDVEIWLNDAPSNIVLVSTEVDDNDTNYSFGNLSLRNALAIAENGDRIIFAPWVQQIDLAGTQLTIADDVEIIGPGADKLTIDAQGNSRVFGVNPNVEATIRGLTITGGYVPASAHGEGGGIFNWGDLTLDYVTITGNEAASQGGGVTSRGNGSSSHASLTITNSTIHGNKAAYGGGVHAGVDSGYSLFIQGTTFSNNEGTGDSGALRIQGPGESRIVNSTFSGNYAPYFGAIWVMSGSTDVEFYNSTIAYNKGDLAGGLLQSGTTTTHNTIIAENKNYAGSADSDVYGNVASASSYNLFGRGGAGGKTHNDANKNLVLSGVQTAGLAPLGDYGGPTRTHALLSSSAAIDGGFNAYAENLNIEFDQRGRLRFVDWDNDEDVDIDIGAFELALGELYD